MISKKNLITLTTTSVKLLYDSMIDTKLADFFFAFASASAFA